jgi:hypothetical protein
MHPVDAMHAVDTAESTDSLSEHIAFAESAGSSWNVSWAGCPGEANGASSSHGKAFPLSVWDLLRLPLRSFLFLLPSGF